jgi:glutamate synthase (NADPH/NADH) large chain
MVSVSETLEGSDERMLRRLVENHRAYTESERAADLLDDWEAALDDFVRVFPDAYAEVIAEGTGADVREEPPAPAAAVPDADADATGQVSSDD